MPNPSRLRTALVRHMYDQTPVAILGSVLTATIFAVYVASSDAAGPLRAWVPMQVVSLSLMTAIALAFKKASLAQHPTRALWLRRASALCLGTTWGMGGLFWPVQSGTGPWLGVIFCCVGLVGAGTTSLAADPLAYLLFVLSMVSLLVIATPPSYVWVAMLLIVATCTTTLVVLRNWKVLKQSFELRWENEELLARAIAERKAADSARARAERADEAKTRFLAAASHDLRQPVQALSLFSHVLASRPNPEQLESVTLDIRRSTDALQGMLEGLLDISRLDSGLVRASPRSVELRALFSDVVAALAEEADAKQMLVSWTGPALSVHADPVLVSRLVHNLASNAVRHANGGRVLLSARRRGDRCLLQVWDQGEGIREKDRASIFEEFVQLGNPERERERGLGLGLPMVRRICELCGWALELRSEVGRGTVFSASLPLAAPEPASELTSELQRQLRSVLVIENDALVRGALAAWVQTLGGQVHLARNGSEALELCARLERDQAFDVVVADQRLSENETGREVIDCVRRATGKITPSILLSGDVDLPRSLDKGQGSLTVLTKPVTSAKLSDAVSRLLA